MSSNTNFLTSSPFLYSIEGNGSKEKISSPKPFWGPSILIPSVRPWFYTTQATRKLPFKSSLPSIDITRDHTTPGNEWCTCFNFFLTICEITKPRALLPIFSDYDFHAIDGPTRKTGKRVNNNHKLCYIAFNCLFFQIWYWTIDELNSSQYPIGNKRTFFSFLGSSYWDFVYTATAC